MGMGMVGRIVKSIFNNLDYRMIQALFKDPTFDLILQVHKCKAVFIQFCRISTFLSAGPLN